MRFTDSSNDQLESTLAGIYYGEKRNMEVDLFDVEEDNEDEQFDEVLDELVTDDEELDGNFSSKDSFEEKSDSEGDLGQSAESEKPWYEIEDGRNAVIKVRNLYKIYKVGTNKVRALNGVDFNVYEGEFCAIVGTSGSGKSTLLNMLAGLEKPSKGEILIDGQHIERMNENQLVKFRRENVGFIFQSFNLIGTMNALENVALPLTFRGVPKMIRLKRAMKLLRLVGLKEHAMHRPNQMSGGQQQRVGMARALVVNPKIMFADEPTGNLDSHTSKDMMNLMREIVNKQKKTLVMVTHDDSLAAIADKVIRIVDGKIVAVEDRSTNFVEDGNDEKE